MLIALLLTLYHLISRSIRMRRTLAAVIIVSLVSAELAAQEPPPASDWNVSLGAGALASPSYPGADEYRIIPFPLTQVAYRNRVFLGPSTTGTGFGIGAYALRTQQVGLAAEVGFLNDRPASRADALAGMDDRDFVATASVSLSYRLNAFEGTLGATQGLNDDAGLLGGMRISYSQRVGGRFIASAGLGATFANARQMRWDFGVTSAEASRRQALIAAGDDRLDADDGSPYDPDGGLRHLGASLSLVYILSPRWSLMGFGGVDRLSDEAATSPLVRRREQFSGGIGLGYRL
jgi:outer membrane scaffolding protein for murein synthesis (MipA/OmpV family)